MAQELKDQVVLKHDDGIIEHDGNKYIRKDSYDVVAEKSRVRKEALEKIEEANKTAEDKKLAENGEYKKLLEEKEAEILKVKGENSLIAKKSALKEAASKMGAANTDTIARLVDLEKIEVDEKGEIKAESITTLLEGMKTAEPYLFAKTAGKGGSGASGSPDGGADPTVKTFKRSQLRDAKFYQENRDDIMAAQKAGQIEDDVS